MPVGQALKDIDLALGSSYNSETLNHNRSSQYSEHITEQTDSLFDTLTQFLNYSRVVTSNKNEFTTENRDYGCYATPDSDRVITLPYQLSNRFFGLKSLMDHTTYHYY